MADNQNMQTKKFILLMILFALIPLMGCSNDPVTSVDGLRKSFYESGAVESEKTYSLGELNGPTHVYYENGVIAWEGHYLNGKLDGIARFFYDTGVIQAQRSYSDGIQTGQAKIFNPEGNFFALFNIQNGRKNGIATYFYPGGTPFKSETYVNGIKDGPEIIYGRGGEIKSEINYHNGKPVLNQKPEAASSITAASTTLKTPTATSAAIPKKRAPQKLPTPEELLEVAARQNPLAADAFAPADEKDNEPAQPSSSEVPAPPSSGE